MDLIMELQKRWFFPSAEFWGEAFLHSLWWIPATVFVLWLLRGGLLWFRCEEKKQKQWLLILQGLFLIAFVWAAWKGAKAADAAVHATLPLYTAAPLAYFERCYHECFALLSAYFSVGALIFEKKKTPARGVAWAVLGGTVLYHTLRLLQNWIFFGAAMEKPGDLGLSLAIIDYQTWCLFFLLALLFLQGIFPLVAKAFSSRKE